MNHGTVDLDEISIQQATVYQYAGGMVVDLLGVDVAEVLETIGEERVRKYFDIRNEE